MKNEKDINQRDLFDDEAKQNQISELQNAYAKKKDKLEENLTANEQKLDAERKRLATLESGSDRKLNAATQHRIAASEQEIAKLETSVARDRRALAELPERQQLGEDAIRSARVTQGPDGEISIMAKVAPSQERLNFQNENRSGLPRKEGQQRLHARGPGTGFECDCGIYYGTSDVNLAYQNSGIEESIREHHAQKRPDTELWLHTVVQRHEGTQQIKDIQYELYYRKNGAPESEQKCVYKASIEVDKQGRVEKINGEPIERDDNKYLTPVPERRSSSPQTPPEGPQHRTSPTVASGPQDRQRTTGSAFGGNPERTRATFAGGLQEHHEAPSERSTIKR